MEQSVCVDAACDNEDNDGNNSTIETDTEQAVDKRETHLSFSRFTLFFLVETVLPSVVTSENSKQIFLVAIKGVATLKVVAVPAMRANTAKRSMKRPAKPSVCLPNTGRHASEYF